jgi:hypothetical protein
VIRFSEYQVVRHPESCCRLIALVLSKLGCDRYLEPLKDFANLPTDRAWTSGWEHPILADRVKQWQFVH